MESAWETRAARWEPPAPTQLPLHAKRAYPHGTPNPTVKKHKATIWHGIVLEGWLDGPCKIHTTTDTVATHIIRACWILRQVAKSGEDILIKDAPEQHPPEDDGSRVLTVFETFTSNNKRKRAAQQSLPNCCNKPME